MTGGGGVLAALLTCWAVASSASAQYRFDSFTTSNGLPQNTVAAVLQARDGYLWIATYDGLVRYDGVRFAVFDKGNTPAIRSTQFLCLFEDAGGVIWAGTVDGGVVRYEDGRVTRLDDRDGLVRNYVERIQASARGVLLFHSATQATLVAPDGRITPADDEARRSFAGAAGATWTHGAGTVTRTLNGRAVEYRVDLPLDDFARLHFEARDGSLWLGTHAGGVFHLAGGQVTHFGAAEGIPDDQVIRVGGEDLAGRVWLQSLADVYAIGAGRVERLDLGMAAPQIRAVLPDRENTVWVGTNNRGLVHVVPDVLHTYTTADGLPSPSVYPLAEDVDGSILAGSSANLARWSDGRVTSIAVPRAVRSLWVDRDGTIWIGTAPGLMTLTHGTLTDRSSLVPGTGIDAMLRDRGGALWAGGPIGLFRIDDAGGSRAYGAAEGLPPGGVTALLQDREGRIWAGTPHGLARLDSPRADRFSVYTTAQGLAGDRVRALYEDSEGALWIGTFDSGLSRLKDGRFTSFTTQTGLFSNGVFAVLEDAQGWLWMSSNRGIFRVPRRELEDVAAGRRALVNSVAYGTRDGMRSVECNGGRQAAGLAARDGRLWFPTQDGLVAIDPARAYRQGPAPGATIESVVVDGAPAAVRGGVRVEAGQSDVEITYSAPSFFKAEAIRFRYALSGLNTGWVDAGTRRTLHYSHLAPGSYTFRIEASDGEGRWSPAETSVAITVLPFFYQTTWFRGAVLVGMVLLGVGVSTLRVHRLQEAERRLTARIAGATAELAEANRQLARLATTDELTRLANRRRFSEFLDQEWQRAVRDGTTVGLLMLDVDCFKRYNDTRGHQEGDACLQRVAETIAAHVKRPADLAARYGGEEFAVVLPGVDVAGVIALGERIREQVERLQLPHGASTVGPFVTVSVGVAVTAPNPAMAVASLVAAADAALYRAKESGRNTVSAGMMEASLDAGTAATRIPRVRIHHPGS